VKNLIKVWNLAPDWGQFWRRPVKDK